MNYNSTPFSTSYLLMASSTAIQSWFFIMDSIQNKNLSDKDRKQVIEDFYSTAFMGGEL